MIGIVLLTHGSLGGALLETLEGMAGIQEQIKCVPILVGEDAEIIRDKLHSTIDELNSGEGVVVLTDMFGGTPSNLAISALGVKQIEVIAGVNLPMLIKLIEDRKVYQLQEAAQRSYEAGRKYIQIASTLLAPIQV